MSRLHTPLCDLLGIDFPILQAGMGRSVGSTTTPELVAAVSEAGGMGCLGATGLEPAEMVRQISRIRKLTSRPFGVNILMPAKADDMDVSRAEMRDLVRDRYPEHWAIVRALYEEFGLDVAHEHENAHALTATLIREQMDVLFDEGVPVIVVGLGDPGPAVQRSGVDGPRVLGIAGSLRNAERQSAAGVHAIIAQGAEAGGHTGRVSTLPLVPQVVDRVSPLPVVAAGGIADGRGIVASLALGAQAVWCGTAFLFSHEAHVIPAHRQQLEMAGSDDVQVSRSYTGKPSRIVSNAVTRAWAASQVEPLPMPLQGVLMDDFVVAAEQGGRGDLVNNPAGEIAGMLSRQQPAAQIVAQMVAQAEEVLDSLQSQVFNADPALKPVFP